MDRLERRAAHARAANALPRTLAALLALALGLCACARPVRTPAPAPASSGGEAFLFSTDDGALMQFWLADPAKTSVRRQVASVRHEPGWPGNSAVSPDGRTLAYTVLPPGSHDPDHGAELMTLALVTGQAQAVARGIDLRSTLVWTNSGSAVSFQTYDGAGERLWLQPPDGGADEMLAEETTGVRLLPVAGAAEGDGLLAARYSGSGVDLVSITTGAKPSVLEHLTDGVARDLVLNPTAGSLAFIATGASDGDPVSRGYVASLKGGAPQLLPAPWGEVVGLAWSPSGTLVAGAAGPSAGLYTLDGRRLQAPLAAGFAEPLGWSPSGHYLALRLFSGSSSEQPGSAREAILAQDGKLATVTDSAPVRFIGWLAEGRQHGAP